MGGHPRILAAETFGTFVLVLGGPGVAVIAGDRIGMVGVALGFGLSLMVMAAVIGPVSGCHINPAVTLGLLLAKKINKGHAIAAWIGVQTLLNLGAVLGVMPITGVPLPLVSYGGSSLLANYLILAVLILAGFAYSYGVDRTPAVVGAVVEGGAAAKAGLRAGDRIVALDGRGVDTFSDLARYALIRPGQQVTVTVARAGRDIETPLTIGTVHQRDRFGNEYRIGRLGLQSGDPVLAPVSLAEAPIAGVRMTGEIIGGTLETIGQIISGRRSIDELGGPIRIAKISGEQMALGVSAFVWLVAMLSINLGFINLLPVPMLDGGHLFFYAIEAVRRRPLEPQVQEWAFRGGLAAVLALMLIVTFNDLGAVGLWQRLAGLIG